MLSATEPSESWVRCGTFGGPAVLECPAGDAIAPRRDDAALAAVMTAETADRERLRRRELVGP
jgi:hypothetical protein